MNNEKICFITCVNDERLYEECLVYINSLDIPKDFSIETIALRGANSIASAYNKAMREVDAKYKVYLHQDTFIINKNFIYDILDIFNKNIDVGMIGVAGVKDIPVSGVWWDSDNKVGKVYDSHTGRMDIYEFNSFEGDFDTVMAIDGLIMITQYDILWREDKFDGWHFYDLSQSMEFNQNNYKVIIPKQDKPWCMHDSGIANISNGYDEYRIKFVKEYIELDLHRENFYEFDKNKASTILKSNKYVVDCMKDELERELKLKNYRTVLDIVSKVARFSVFNHTGLYSCEKCEKALLECANNLPKVNNIKLFKKKDFKRKRVLHVLSEVYSTGGHTKVVKNWINSDKDSVHSIVTTWQSKTLPDWLLKSVNDSGGEIISLDSISDDYLERAVALRTIAYDWADIVILYIHMWDTIPVLAFGIDGKIPILYVNHYDSAFWLGASIADVVIDFSEVSQLVTLNKRGIEKSEILPIPLKEKELFSKSEIRKQYDLDDDVTIILTIASERKYNSVNDINYFKIAKMIIENTDDTIIIVVGVDTNNIYWKTLNSVTNDRVLCFGTMEEIDDFYKISDIYLESFMVGSHISKLDAILYDLIPVKFKNEVSPIFTNMWDFIDKFDYNNIKEVIDMIKRYNTNEFDRNELKEKQSEIKHFVIDKHCVEIKSYIDKIYNEANYHKVKYNLHKNDEIENYQLFVALYGHIVENKKSYR
ncbi:MULTISPECIES: glycosyltransferase family protein [unclassified Clostridioides]|uniref:glycosyltransferase family protein n=1 Tax=unclassified Clostridioides TaxID=2635829 RepID=UPI001D1098D2|nr:glycosyltransferase family protein [Clostridioides sp. ZZV14-6150]MCC0663359.1 glycosyltransferase family protein [Clostridioides sp. ZZV15-6597]MCC0722539.1 glycosyltransferase family protein [Clostridioides sp. ZZV14-6104]MCC0743324.1 glycosyltransferase family protein [Clostridioides sp. ZZV14-6044]MCC0751507.1 glycosyltransferase family protein [Clostridioides sp. ZZV13-5731]